MENEVERWETHVKCKACNGTGEIITLMNKIQIPMMFDAVQMDIEVYPHLTLEGRVIEGLTKVRMSYHGYQMMTNLNMLAAVQDAALKSLESLHCKYETRLISKIIDDEEKIRR